MRIVLTGAAGFLGSHLSRRFLDDGYEVLGVDNLVTGSRDNVAWLQESEGFSFREHDVSTPLFVSGPVDGVAAEPRYLDIYEACLAAYKRGELTARDFDHVLAKYGKQ